MGAVAGIIGAAASAVSAVGGVIGAMGQANAMEAQAAEQERVAQERRAEATRVQAERQREQELTQSRFQAVAASSGAGATDPTTNRLFAGIAQEGDYQRRGAIYEGESQARVLEGQAEVSRMQARTARVTGMISGFGNALGGLTTMARFRPRQPQRRPSTGFYY